MIEGLPWYIPLVFFLTTLLTIWFLIAAARPAKNSTAFRLLIFLIPLWLLLTGFLATTGFYRFAEAMPPRVVAFGVLPSLLCIAGYFAFFRSSFVDKLSLRQLTLLHTVRIPVELVLLWLYQAGQVPRIMTFDGWNFDILSGLSAPIVFWFAFRNGVVRRGVLIAWNLLALGLLFTIVSIAALSFRSPMQQLAFDQPNVGVTYLPFIWLPALIVPIVLFAHLASLRQLRKPTSGRS